MTTVNDLYPSRFLKAEADFDEGETKTLTISSFEIEELGKTKKETKPVLYFKELDKGLVLNKTNAAIIAENLGTETLEEWVGRQITLFTMEVQSFDDIVRAIRVKPKSKMKATASRSEPAAPAARAPLMSLSQRNKIIELYGERFGGTETEIIQGLDAVFDSAFKHPFDDATLAEASKIISQMIAQKPGSQRPFVEAGHESTRAPSGGNANGATAVPKPTNGNTQPVTQKSDAEVIAGEIRVLAQKIPNGTQPPDLKSLQRLAAVVNASFGNQPTETQDAMRHSVYSYVVGKEVQTGRDLTFGLVNAMLTRWESTEAYKPNDIASWETNAISFEYQTQRGQTTLTI